MKKSKTKTSPDEESRLDQPCWLNNNVSHIIKQLKLDDGIFDKNKNALRIIESLLYTFVCRLKSCYPLGKEKRHFVMSIQRIYDKLMTLEGVNEQMEYVKYFTALLAWKRVKSERDPPDRPEFVLETDRLFTGYLRRFLGIAKARGDLTIPLSLSNAKRLWYKPPVEKVISALKGHSITLSTENTIPPHAYILEEIHNVVKELFSTENIRATSFTPSQSACLQASRRNNGCLSLFKPFKMSDALLYCAKGPLNHNIKWTRTYPMLPQQLMALFNEHRDARMHRVEEVAKHGLDNKLVKVVCLYEPGGKIRILGVEDGYYSSYIQPLQGMLLDIWKRDKSSTMVADVDDLVIKTFDDKFSIDQTHFVSGDYSHATDDMKKRLSAEALKACLMALDYNSLHEYELIMPLDDEHRAELMRAREEMVRDNPGLMDEIETLIPINEATEPFIDGRRVMSLMEHVEEFTTSILEYPKSVEYDDPTGRAKEPLNKPLDIAPVVQRNGQRMGNRKSFPILCIVNKACYRAACRLYVEELNITPKERAILLQKYYDHVIVNGDDILFKCGLRLYEIWSEMVTSVGWAKSPGKNYVCKGFAQINSRNYRIKNNKLERVGYLNLKLVTGFSTKKVGATEADPECLGENLNEMVKFCPWSAPAIPKCLIRFDKRYKGTFKPNWYLKPHLGGYGIDPSFCEGTYGISRDQRKVAALLTTNIREHLTRKFEYKEARWEEMHDSLRRYQPPIYIAKKSDIIDPEIFTEDFSENTGRLTLIHQWANAGKQFCKEEKKSFLQGAKKWQSIKPMTLENLEEYKEPRYYSLRIPSLPPLMEIGPWRQRPLVKARVSDYPLYEIYLKEEMNNISMNIKGSLRDEADDDSMLVQAFNNENFNILYQAQVRNYAEEVDALAEKVIQTGVEIFHPRSHVADVNPYDLVESQRFFESLINASEPITTSPTAAGIERDPLDVLESMVANKNILPKSYIDSKLTIDVRRPSTIGRPDQFISDDERNDSDMYNILF